MEARQEGLQSDAFRMMTTNLVHVCNVKESLIHAEHALHVLEIIEAARKSQQKGARIHLRSSFPWPTVS